MRLHFYIEPFQKDNGQTIYNAECHVSDFNIDIGDELMGWGATKIPKELFEQLRPTLESAKQKAIKDVSHHLSGKELKLLEEVGYEALPN